MNRRQRYRLHNRLAIVFGGGLGFVAASFAFWTVPPEVSDQLFDQRNWSFVTTSLVTLFWLPWIGYNVAAPDTEPIIRGGMFGILVVSTIVLTLLLRWIAGV